MPDILCQEVKYLKGVGPRRAKLFEEEWHVRTLEDLLSNYPYKYIDRTKVFSIRDLQEGIPFVQLKGRIISFDTEGEGYKRRLKAVFSDGTGYIDLVWFNGIKYIQSNYKLNVDYLLIGHPTVFNGRFSVAHPEIDEAGKIKPSQLCLTPVYSFTEKMKRGGFTTRLMKDIIDNVFSLIGTNVEETLPQTILANYHLQPRYQAVHTIHLPNTSEELPAATERLKFEELFFLQLAILRYAKNQRLNYKGFVFSKIGSHFLDFYHKNLPFELTDAQKKVIKEIRSDVATGHQMNRLLQGDVGSGKTIVALLSCLMAIDNGYQACLMAPTEILAEQHYATLIHQLRGIDVKVELLTGIVKGKRRKAVLEGLADGSVHIIVGTHAVIEPTVIFQNLGFVVIDEQHRFGVKQRAKLWVKNVNPPHVLVMTATPIPRTLAMTVYGDLNVSIIDQLPPGRKPIKTLHYYQERLDKLYDGIKYELSLGHQVYAVYPLIEESEKTDLKDLEQGFELWKKRFPGYKVGKVHGRMKSEEKDAVMQDFISGKIQILVSTTVIEVGVNVPNASVMVIEEAQRFGLAQLHQLRGRVGRGAEQSYCILVTGYQMSEVTRRRIQIMIDTTDGFVIAEEDLKMRGPGDLEGTQQSGLPFELKVANITKDSAIMERAREAAENIIAQDPYENLPQFKLVWDNLKRLRDQTINFSAIS